VVDDNVAGSATDVGTRNGYWNSMKWDPNRYADPTGTINTVHNNNMLLSDFRLADPGSGARPVYSGL